MTGYVPPAHWRNPVSSPAYTRTQYGYAQFCPAGRFGVCALCGWQGNDAPDEATALADLERHGKHVHGERQ